MKTKAAIIIFYVILVCIKAINAQTITGFEAPESALKTGNKIFVSNIGGAQPNPMALDSNGYISELSADGKIIQQKFSIAILNAPKGLAVAGNVLYTADINRVVGFDINSGKQVFELNIPDAKMLNDLCPVDNSRIVVSETVSGKIYLINTNNKSTTFLGSIDGANGVTYNASSKKIYACGMGANMNGTGKLYEKDIDSKDTTFTALKNSPTGIFDGLEFVDATHLLATDWISFTSDKGRFVVYDLNTNTSKTYSVDAGPADIGFDKSTQIYYLPQIPKNSVLIGKLGDLK